MKPTSQKPKVHEIHLPRSVYTLILCLKFSKNCSSSECRSGEIGSQMRIKHLAEGQEPEGDDEQDAIF